MITGSERRDLKRDHFTVTLDYAFSTLENGRLDCKKGSAVSVNISKGGLGIYSLSPFSVGQDLKLFCEQLRNTPINAQIRWCSKVSNDLYKVGIMFN